MNKDEGEGERLAHQACSYRRVHKFVRKMLKNKSIVPLASITNKCSKKKGPILFFYSGHHIYLVHDDILNVTTCHAKELTFAFGCCLVLPGVYAVFFPLFPSMLYSRRIVKITRSDACVHKFYNCRTTCVHAPLQRYLY